MLHLAGDGSWRLHVVTVSGRDDQSTPRGHTLQDQDKNDLSSPQHSGRSCPLNIEKITLLFE